MGKYRIVIVLCLMAGLSFRGYGQFIYPPDLQCVEKDAANSTNILRWTNAPNSCGAFNNYTIYASQSPTGPFSQLAQVTVQSQTSYTHTGATGNWYYYIVPDFNCPGSTALSSDTVSNLNPATPEIVNVTVTPGGDVIINWLPGTSPETHGYVVYYYLPNGNAVPIDTVYGRYTTTYTDIVGDPTTQSLVYTVAAFDSCWKSSAFNTSPHNTIYMTAGTAACEHDITMTWNKYINWPQGVKEYQIWATINGGTPIWGGVTDSSTLTFKFGAFSDGDNVCVTVRAMSAADTNVVSNSNVQCLQAAIVQAPQYLFITNATVDLSNQITITWMLDSNAELIFTQVGRSTNNTVYAPAVQIPAPATLTQFNMHIDSDGITPQKNPYWYKITVFDSCQNQYTSPEVKTVHLFGELYDYYVSHLVWNDFELMYATVLRYNLYRNYGTGYQLIQTLAPGTNEFADSLQQFVNEKGIFCYRIEAVYYLNLPNGYSDTLSSFSNEQCIIHRPIVYIPNAFAPYGVNNVFKPTIIYGEPKGYLLTIYNRWGARIFESTDPAIGWDGTDRGADVPQGGYAYLLQFTAADGVRVERKGMVLLVK